MVIRIKEGRGRPKGDDPLQKVTIVLRAGDMDWIHIMYGDRKASEVIRKWVSERIDQEQAPKSIEPMDLDTTIGILKDE